MTTPGSDEAERSLQEIARSNARLQVLADISHAFAMVATDYDRLLPRIAKTTSDLVGDGCNVTLVAEDGDSLINTANAHRDPEIEEAYRSYLAGHVVSKRTSASISAVVARTGEPRLVPECDPASVVATTDENLKPLVAKLNVCSFAVVPIRAGADALGTLSIVRSEPGKGYTQADIVLLQGLADRAGLAIANARLYRALDQRVLDRTRELEAANEELEAFSYSVAHDLRAPLRSIDGFSLALLEDYGDALDEEGRQHLVQVRDGAQRMALLIDALLSLSRVSRTEIRRVAVDLTALAHLVEGRLRQQDQTRSVDVSIEAGLSSQGDPRLSEIVLTNLVGNAWKFTQHRPAAKIEIGARDARTFFVRDNGAGFDPRYAHKLFGVFQRLHTVQEFEGTGIGLATVHRIMRRHGGRVWAESEVDRGATFYFTFAAGPAQP